MPAPLPSALRARFEEYIAEGLSGRAAAARLKLSAATGVRWKRKLHETGAIEPAPRGRPRGYGKLAPHQAFLEELVSSTLSNGFERLPVSRQIPESMSNKTGLARTA